MSIKISFREQSIEAVSLQVKEKLQGTTLTRSKVVESCKAIFEAQERESFPVKFYLKKVRRRFIDKNREDGAMGAFAEKVWERVRVVPGDSIDRLPVEVLKQVLSQFSGVGNALIVSPQFNAAAKAVMLERAEVALSNAFGAKQWMEFMGAEVGAEPPLPENILEILAGLCPFSRDKIVADTHLLMLIPETINGQPLNLKTLGRLFKAKFPSMGDGTGYRHISAEVEDTLGNYGKSRWVLMTRDVIERSRNERFAKQQALVAKRGQNNYEVPFTLEAAACILLEYARTNGQTRLYSEEPWTYTRCQEPLDGFKVIVGGFQPDGLFIGANNYINKLNHICIGVAAIMQFA
jgi:hypothetical protein